MKLKRHARINELVQPITQLCSKQSSLRLVFALALVIASFTAMTQQKAQQKKSSFADLTKLFGEWRTFQQPKVIDGVPDYSAPAMSAQHRELARYQRRLAGIDTSGWPINQQVDWHVVRAEMNGLDFDHRVLRPWANNPAFYVTVFLDRSDQPAREGPHAYGAVETWKDTFPLAAERAAEMHAALRMIPNLLEQARRLVWQSSSATPQQRSSLTLRWRRKRRISLLGGWKHRPLQRLRYPGSASRTMIGT